MSEQTSFRDYVIAVTLGGMFFVCIMFFAVGIATNYNVSSDQISNEYLNTTEFTDQLETQKDTSEVLVNNTQHDKMGFESGMGVLSTIFGTVNTIWNSITSFTKLIFYGAWKILGIPNSIYYGFLGLFSICIILSIWRLIRQGE